MAEKIEKKDLKGNVNVSFEAYHFPLTQFLKWEDDCKKNFGGLRWVKMVNDHEKAKMYDIMTAESEEIVNDKVETKEPEKKKITLLSGEEIEEGD